MKRHIIYIHGLGDSFNVVRKLGLSRWRRPTTKVTLISMHWQNSTESYEEKLARISKAIECYEAEDIFLVGESAGGAVAIAAMQRNASVTRLVTVCGLNHRADAVDSNIYAKHPALRDAMYEADKTFNSLTSEQKAIMLTIYSSNDKRVREKYSLIPGVKTVDIEVKGHMLSIGYVLFVKPKLIFTR